MQSACAIETVEKVDTSEKVDLDNFKVMDWLRSPDERRVGLELYEKVVKPIVRERSDNAYSRMLARRHSLSLILATSLHWLMNRRTRRLRHYPQLPELP